jgi:hypothetical protein
LSNSTVSGNATEYAGGGITNDSIGTLVIINSTFSGNSASYGGGIFNYGRLTVTDSTLSGNSAGGYSNIYDGLGGGILNWSQATVTNTTLSGNSAVNHGGDICNGGNFSEPILKIGNTILNGGPSGENIYNESGTAISLGYNLSSDNGGGYLTATGDRINTNPRLGPLQNNGGPTFTHLPALNSPAIDAGDPTLGGDQRGSDFVRVMNCRIDIGAVEVQATPTPSPTPTPHGHGHGRN